MASVDREDEDYESDPEEAKLLMAMRRRVASDDEEEEEESVGDGVERKRDELVADVRVSDDQGGVEVYGGEEEEDLTSVEIENEVEVKGGGVDDEKDGQEDGDEEEESKEKDPFAVPTGGAFYMHDDRFRDNAAARNRTQSAQKLWESKDERRWGHDKFEQLTSQDSPYNEPRRNPKGHNRGRGRIRGSGRGYGRGDRSKMPEDVDDQAPVSMSVKGRGSQRYNPAYKHRNEVPQIRNKQSEKYLKKNAHFEPAQGLAFGSTEDYDAVSAMRNPVASNLNSASPPFYPSETSNMDSNQAPKIDVQPLNTNRNSQTSSVKDNLATKHTNSVPRWKEKEVGDSSGLKKLSLDDTTSKRSNKSQQHPSGFTNSQGRQVRTQERGRGYARHVPPLSTSHLNHANQLSGAQQHATQNRSQLYSQNPAHAVQIAGGSLASSSPPGGYASSKSFDIGEETTSESSIAKTDVIGKAAVAVQGGDIGPFMYNGAHIMGGNMGVSHGEQNFPAFLPVMQFGSQHPGGIGVPAVGMAFPGYVQPQHGQGNSEMTWLPVLAGAAGALGATYCPPYMLDGSSYNPQLPDQQSASGSSNTEDNTKRAISSQKLEHAGDGFEQRQSKPRRYSEMKFGQ